MSGTLLDKLYPLRSIPPVTAPKKQMQVLCLGLSRSGTDSLRNALLMLGYDDVYHGFVVTSRRREDAGFWVPLMREKFSRAERGVDQKLSGINFDKVLSSCEAVTDGPTNIFGEELMDFYPDAKVILNRRRDTDAWYRSVQATCLEVFGWPMWTLSWFDARLYWLWYNFLSVFQGYYQGDFKLNGKKVAKKHYESLEASLTRRGREYLDWSVEDGWEPLCRYLGKPVPKEPFPSGNKGGGQFEQNMEEATKDMVMNAAKNMGILLLSSIVLGVALWKGLRST